MLSASGRLPPIASDCLSSAAFASFVSTHGKWLGRYGTLGYALFAFEQHFDPRKYYQPGGVSRHQLAIGICSAQGLCLKDTAWLAPESPVVALRTPIKCGTTLQRRTAGRVARADAPAGRQQQQPQHLQPPPSYLQDPTFWHSGDRALGHAVGGADGSQGLVIDIETAPCSSQCPPFLLSVYFVGADADTQLAVRIMDLVSLDARLTRLSLSLSPPATPPASPFPQRAPSPSRSPFDLPRFVLRLSSQASAMLESLSNLTAIARISLESHGHRSSRSHPLHAPLTSPTLPMAPTSACT